jgi:hypothetical protein
MKERIVGAIAILVFGFGQWILGYITGWCAADSKHLEKEVAETKKLIRNPFRKRYVTIKREGKEVEEESE